MLNDIPTSALTVLSLNIKVQNVVSRPIPVNLQPFSKIVGIIFPLIAVLYLVAQGLMSDSL